MSPLLLRGDESVYEVEALLCVVFQFTSGIGGAEGVNDSVLNRF